MIAADVMKDVAIVYDRHLAVAIALYFAEQESGDRGEVPGCKGKFGQNCLPTRDQAVQNHRVLSSQNTVRQAKRLDITRSPARLEMVRALGLFLALSLALKTYP